MPMITNDILQSVKEVPLPRLLADFGILPARKKDSTGRSCIYLASYRNEHHPSLSVFMASNSAQWLFKDHATGEVGTNIDLLVRFGLFRCWREAAIYIADKYLGVQIDSLPSVAPRIPSLPKHAAVPKPSGIIRELSSIIGSPAEKYITKTRRIPINIADQFVSFARYSFDDNGKIFHGIAWPTCRGGWSIRWPIDLGHGKGKTVVGPGGISFFPRTGEFSSDDCAIFEGIFDFLTFIKLHGHISDAIVLNSVDNVKDTYDRLAAYKRIVGYLDNDRSGRECWIQLKGLFYTRAIDASPEFAGYKDYNDFLKAQ